MSGCWRFAPATAVGGLPPLQLLAVSPRQLQLLAVCPLLVIASSVLPPGCVLNDGGTKDEAPGEERGRKGEGTGRGGEGKGKGRGRKGEEIKEMGEGMGKERGKRGKEREGKARNGGEKWTEMGRGED